MAKLRCKRGDTWSVTSRWRDYLGVPIDLEGCTARQWITRKNNATPVLELSTTTGELTLVEDPDETPGLLCNIYTRVEAEEMDLIPGDYEFDQEVTFPDGTVISTATTSLVIIKDITL